MQAAELTAHLDQYLAVDEIQDLAPNGLQVEGREQVSKIALGVTASLAFLHKARDWGAEMAIVHHGLFWRSPQQMRVERSLRQRLKTVLDAEMTLLAYHLPLDRHLELGNNAVMARKLGVKQIESAFPFNGVPIGIVGLLEPAIAAGDLFASIAKLTERDPFVVADGPEMIGKIGIVTGGGPKLVNDASRLGLDLYITGEPNEAAVHVAREEGIHFVAAGHHATERFGVQALADYLRHKFGLDAQFIEVGNPI